MAIQDTQAAPRAGAAPGGMAYAYFVAILLAVIYTFNFLDRQILSILQEPIRKELNLSDTQLGMLTGLAFAFMYTFMGIPVAWLADRSRRITIIGAACAIWSLFSAACGLATNFTQLLLARIGVAFGEAGGSPPSYSLISDYFPPQKRGVGLAIYSLGVPLGSAIGTGVGGTIAAHYGWRVAFFSVGIPGLVLAALALMLIREPKRGGLDAVADGAVAHAPSPPLSGAIAAFFRNPVLVLTAISSALSAFVGYSMLNWAPSFLIRVKGMSLQEVAVYYAILSGATSAFGTFCSGWLVDKFGRGNRRAYALVPAAAFAISLPFFIGFIFAPSWPIALAFLAGPSLLNNMYLAPAITVVQNAVSPSMRTTASALLLFILNMVGLGGGPVMVGMISDAAKPQYGEASLMIGLGAIAPFIVLTVIAHYAASRALRKGSTGA